MLIILGLIAAWAIMQGIIDAIDNKPKQRR